jgi:hypothetical protein
MAAGAVQRKISTYHTLIISLVFILAGILLVTAVNLQMKHRSLDEARTKARIILDRNLATHTYFTHELKPGIFSLTEPYRPKDYFDPTWMSSTYAVRQIDQYFRSFSTEDYYYKECAINARSPLNEADDYEKTFILNLNKNPKLQEQSEIRVLDGKQYFVVLRRGEELEQTCLRCHSTPDQAPGGLIRRYGADRSFHRAVGEVISAISIHIPLSVPYAEANRFSFVMSGILLITLTVMYLLLLLINQRLLFNPLNRIKEMTSQISMDDRFLGEEIAMPVGRELQELTTAFNIMSVNLRHNKDHLEEKVAERTAKLQEALANIKKLGGLLPICASCKKIRDDEGYWKQVEVYIHEHSEAEFTHSICPECAKKIYPEYYKDQG